MIKVTILLLFLIVGCKQTTTNETSNTTSTPVKEITYTCNDLPEYFDSLDLATQLVKQATFPYSDNFDTSRSSFIRSAHYYSCNNQTGYLILGLRKEYIYFNISKDLWLDFKQADSLGSFYNSYIKGR